LNTGAAASCGLVVRTPTGALFGTTIAGGGYIVAKYLNIAAAEAAGIDVQLAYRWDVGNLGKMSATFSGSYLQHETSQPISTVAAYDCAGLYGPTCQTVNPRWRHIARLSWQTPLPVLVSAQWRFIGSVKLDNNTGIPELLSTAPGYGAGVYDSFDARLPSISYLDLTVIWDVSKNMSVRAGVNNVLDKDPPLVSSLLAGTGLPNTYPSYDLLGRVMFAAFTAKF
jgi:iron complex outermembrane receptor protein